MSCEYCPGCNYTMSDGRVCRESPINPDSPCADWRCLEHKNRRSYTLCETVYCDWWTNRESGFCTFCDDKHRKKMAAVLREELKREELVADICLSFLQDRRSLRSRRVQRVLENEFTDDLTISSTA